MDLMLFAWAFLGNDKIRCEIPCVSPVSIGPERLKGLVRPGAGANLHRGVLSPMFDWFISQTTVLTARCCRRPGRPVTVLAILTGPGVFGEISEDVSEREDKGFDRTILPAMRNARDISKP